MSSIDSAVQSVVSAQQASLANQVATSVAAKSLDSVKQQGEAAVELISQAAQLSKDLNSGSVFDAQA